MKVLTLDFETYYDREYSLSKMSTEAYINDPRFEVIMCGVRTPDSEYHMLDGAHGIERMREDLIELGAEKYPILAHNMYFDGAILAWRLGIVPKLYLDTMCMAMAKIRHETGSVALKSLAEYYHLPAKGTAVANMLARSRDSLNSAEYRMYADYCKNDVSITFHAWQFLEDKYPREELLLIDRTIRMFTQPSIRIDRNMCVAAHKELEEELQQLVTASGVDLDTLMSNDKFAEKLTTLGVSIPNKISKTTGKRTFAFAKTDEPFLALRNHPNSAVRALMDARLKAKSTIERTRMDAFIGIHARAKSKLPIPLKYYGAHTGRHSGMDKINLQNLTRGSLLRKALRAPKGHYIVAADQAQIEARVNACFSGQDDLVQDFRNGVDIYSKFAGENIYGFPVNKDDNPTERFMGKTCILGLGFRMGAARLQDSLSTSSNPITEDFALRCVQAYRGRYPMIRRNWYVGDDMVKLMASGGETDWGPLRVRKEGIVLPNGLTLNYPEIHYDAGTDEYRYVERVRKARVGGAGKHTKIHGGVLVENAVQAMARITLMHQLVKLSMRWWVAMTVHDEIVFIIPTGEIEEARDHITKVMTTPPTWMPKLPVAIDFKYGETYADCK